MNETFLDIDCEKPYYSEIVEILQKCNLTFNYYL